MSDYRERLYTLLGDILHEQFGWDDLQRVASFEELTNTGGYCETCYYEETVLDVTYDTINGETVTKTWYGTLADLMSYM